MISSICRRVPSAIRSFSASNRGADRRNRTHPRPFEKRLPLPLLLAYYSSNNRESIETIDFVVLSSPFATSLFGRFKAKRCSYSQALANIFFYSAPHAAIVTPWEAPLVVEWITGRAGKLLVTVIPKGYTARCKIDSRRPTKSGTQGYLLQKRPVFRKYTHFLCFPRGIIIPASDFRR